MDLSPQEVPRPWEDPRQWMDLSPQEVPRPWEVPLQWMDLSPQEVPRPEMNPPIQMVKPRPKWSGTTIPAKTPKAATTSGKAAWSAPT